MVWIDRVAIVAAGACAFGLGCGPAERDPEAAPERSLVIIDSPRGEGELALLDPSGRRSTLPFAGVGSSTVWGLDGDVLVVRDEEQAVWGWSEASPEPWLLQEASDSADSRKVRIAPDTRYLRSTNSGSDDVYWYSTSVIDLLDGHSWRVYSGCGDAESLFSWHGSGPSAVVLGNVCMGLGEVSEYDLAHVTAEGASPLFDISIDDVPRIRASQSSELLYVVYEDRWQLYDYVLDAVVHEAQQIEPGVRYAWSADGDRFYRSEGDLLTAYGPRGRPLWTDDLGIQPSSFYPAPVGRGLLMMSGDCLGGSCPVVYDGDGLRGGLVDRPVWGVPSWAPDGHAVIVGPDAPDGPMQWWDLEQRSLHALVRIDGDRSWSPDGQTLVVHELCSTDDESTSYTPTRLHLFDNNGLAIAQTPCADYRDAVWSTDSDRFATTIRTRGSIPEEDEHRIVFVDLDGEVTEVGPGRIAGAGWRPGVIR